MTQIALAQSFVDALARLDSVDTKRTAAFLDKLIEEPDANGLHLETVHGANDRSVRSMRVTVDLRAIAQRLGGQLLLLFVGQHDDAYSWARAHCIGCESGADRPAIAILADHSAAVQPAYAAQCTVQNGRELCRALENAGIDHGLAH